MSEEIAVKAHPSDHIRDMVSLMARGAHVRISGIPDDPSFLSSNFGPDTAREIAEEMARRDAVRLAADDCASALEAAYSFIFDEYYQSNRDDGECLPKGARETIDRIVNALIEFRKATGDTQ